MSRRQRIAAIIHEVCTRHRVTAGQLFGPRQAKAISVARMEAMYRVRTEMRLSTPLTGAIFKRDHTTVVTACQKVRKVIETGQEWPCHAEPSDEPFDVGPINFEFVAEPKIGRPVGAKSAPKPKDIPAEGTKAMKAQALADKINRYWRAQGREANARPVWDGGRIVVKSDISLVETRA